MRRNERIAHDLICIIKYGSIGGDVSASEISRLVNHMESTGLVQRELPTVKMPAVTIPKIDGKPVVVMHKPDAPSIKLDRDDILKTFRVPSIRLP